MLLEVWSETEGDIQDTSSLDTSAADYYSMPFDGSHVVFNETDGFTGRIRGFFIGPYTGNVSFYLQASGPSALYISPDTNPANKEQTIAHLDSVGDIWKGSPHSRQVAFVEGELYYIEAVLVQPSGSPSDPNFLKMSLWQHKTKHHASQTNLANDPLQGIIWEYDREFETQKVTLALIP